MPYNPDKSFGDYTRADFVDHAKHHLDKDFSETTKPLGGADEFVFYAERCVRRAEQFAMSLCGQSHLTQIILMFAFAHLEEVHNRATRLWNRTLALEWPTQPPVTFWWMAGPSAASLSIEAAQYFVTGGYLALLQTFGDANGVMEWPASKYQETDWKTWEQRFRENARYPTHLGWPLLLLKRDCELLRLRLHEEFRQLIAIPKRNDSDSPKPGTNEPIFRQGITGLTPKQRAAFSLIQSLDRHLKGIAVASQLNIEESTFRSHYVPALTPHGLRNDDDGYYIEPM